MLGATGFIGLHVDAWTAIGTWMTFGVLACSAGFAFVQIRDARSLREEESRPVVVVDFDVDKKPHMIYLYFENLGRTTAHDVRLTFDPPLQSKTFKVEFGFFNHTFPTLPPGKRIESFFDSSTERLSPEADLPAKYSVTVKYKDRHRKEWTDSYLLDIEALRGRMFVGEKTMEDVAKAVEDIHKQLSAWRTGFGGMKVVVQQEKDAIREQQKWLASRREQSSPRRFRMLQRGS